MGISIDINARYQPIKDARQQIEMLGTSLQNVQGLSDIGEIGFDASQSERVKEMVNQVNRLNTIAGQGDRRGGVLDPKQMAESQRLMLQLTKGIQEYGKEIDKLKQKHRDMMREEREIQSRISTGKATPEDITRRKQLRGEQETTGAEIDRLQKDEARIQRVRQDARHAANNIGGMDMASQSNMASMLKKSLGLALAAAGGFSILGFLGQSRGKYQQSVSHEATLAARGVKGGFDDNIGIGIGPLEQMALLEKLSQQTGMSGKHVQGAANLSGAFGKYTGVDPSQVAETYNSMYHATGNADLGTGAVLMMGDAVKKGLDKARMTELMQLVNRNTQTTAQAMGGAGANSNQAGAATALAIEALLASQNKESYGQFAKSQEFSNVMQNGLQGAGTGAGDIRLFQAMGGFNGPMTWEKIHEMNMIKQGGFMDRPELLQKIIGGMSGSPEARAGQLETMFKQWGITGKGSEQLVKMHDSGFLERIASATKGGRNIEDLSKGSVEDKKLYQEWKENAKDIPGMGKLQLEAERERTQLETGQKLNQALGTWEKLALKMTGSILDGNGVSKLVGAIEKLASLTNSPATKAASFAGDHPFATGAGLIGGYQLAKRLGPKVAAKVLPKLAARAGVTAATAGTGVGIPLAATMAVGGTMWTLWDVYQAAKEELGGQSFEDFKKSMGDYGGGTQPSSPQMASSHGPTNGSRAWRNHGKQDNQQIQARNWTIGKKRITDNNDGTFKVLEGSRAWRNHGKQDNQQLQAHNWIIGKKRITDNNDGTFKVLEGSRNWRNHNPGNIEFGPFAKEQGAIGSDGRFAIFKDYASGRKAKENLLFGDRYKNLTATDAIAKWAPGHENPNLKKYQQAALRSIGGHNIRLRDFTPEQRKSYMDAMEQFEGYKEGKTYTVDRSTLKNHGMANIQENFASTRHQNAIAKGQEYGDRASNWITEALASVFRPATEHLREIAQNTRRSTAQPLNVNGP